MKAISLISGGLDSTLATKVVLDQGVEVIAANFSSPFCRCNRADGCRHEAKFVSEKLGIPLKVVNISKDFLEVLKSPKHGYGSHMNPCIDCRILMLKKAKELMQELGASFLITGEVVGQRPMSQRRDTLRRIEKEAGLLGLILRPLSAKILDPTIPEEKGWVDRSKLLDISGRSRRVQMEMANDFHIKDYPCPAGGCLLTDPAFSKRVKDLVVHNELTLEDVNLLKHGRHFRLTEKARLIVGRNEQGNKALESLCRPGDLFFSPPEEVSGASALGRGDFSLRKTIILAAGIVSRYFDGSTTLTINPEQATTFKSGRVERVDKKAGAHKVAVLLKLKQDGNSEVLEVEPFGEEESKRYLI